MSRYIKLNRVVGYATGSKIARLNVDQIQFYFPDGMTQGGNLIEVTTICFNEYMVHVLETPEVIDDMIKGLK